MGYGDISPAQIAHKIDAAGAKDEEFKLKAIPESAVSDIRVMGVGDLLTRMATCCKPVPGDRIVGYITRGKGVTVHRADCTNITNSQETERLIPVSWGHVEHEYPVVVMVEAFDRSGLLRDIAGAVADLSLSMSSASVSTNADHTASIVVTVGVKSVSQLSTLLGKLQSVRNVLDIHRVRAT